MAWKVITFLAIFAVSEARPPTSEQWVKIENWISHKPESHEVYASAYPYYEFTYEVSDPHTHDFKGHHEERKGDDVKGYYWLIQPDGLKRTVKYRADKHSGFKANVEYTKHWKEDNKKQEGEANEEENTGGNENSETEENENGQENENGGNEEEETENNESGEEEEADNGEDQGEAEESENQENWYYKRNHLSIRNHGRRDKEQKSHGRELKATVGIWQPNLWTKRHHNQELRFVRSEHKNEKKGKNIRRGENENGEESDENSKGENRARNRGTEKHQNERRHSDAGKGSSKHGHKRKNEKHRQIKEENKKNEKNQDNNEEQRNDGNGNSESNEGKHKGISKKTEYHVVIHHPKYHKNIKA